MFQSTPQPCRVPHKQHSPILLRHKTWKSFKTFSLSLSPCTHSGGPKVTFLLNVSGIHSFSYSFSTALVQGFVFACYVCGFPAGLPVFLLPQASTPPLPTTTLILYPFLHQEAIYTNKPPADSSWNPTLSLHQPATQRPCQSPLFLGPHILSGHRTHLGSFREIQPPHSPAPRTLCLDWLFHEPGQCSGSE